MICIYIITHFAFQIVFFSSSSSFQYSYGHFWTWSTVFKQILLLSNAVRSFKLRSSSYSLTKPWFPVLYFMVPSVINCSYVMVCILPLQASCMLRHIDDLGLRIHPLLIRSQLKFLWASRFIFILLLILLCKFHIFILNTYLKK